MMTKFHEGMTFHAWRLRAASRKRQAEFGNAGCPLGNAPSVGLALLRLPDRRDMRTTHMSLLAASRRPGRIHWKQGTINEWISQG